jgi:DNA repair exonuclease SbcCD nuclease subunit
MLLASVIRCAAICTPISRSPGNQVRIVFRFLHAADLHLDSPLLGLEYYPGAPADRIRSATRRALENLVALAVSERVAFVLLAGDVYDGDWKDYNTGLFFAAQMTRLRREGIAVFLIRGNHDAANLMTRSLILPDNVRQFPDAAPATQRLVDVHVAVHGQGFAAREVRQNLAAGYPPPTVGCFNIGLLHTSLNDRKGHDTYAPCTPDQLAQRGYDYWALGHIHQREAIRPSNPAIVFSGNPQGRHVRETGAKGCQLLAVADNRIVANEFRPLDVVRWAIVDIDLAGTTEPDRALEIVEQQLREAVDTADGRLLAARLQIGGNTAAHAAFVAQREHWVQQFRALCSDRFGETAWIEKVCFATEPPGDSSCDGLPEDSLAELQKLVDELRTDDEGLTKLLAEMRYLDGRLPAALKQGDEPLQLTKPQAMRSLLDRVLPLVTSPRWQGSERP